MLKRFQHSGSYVKNQNSHIRVACKVRITRQRPLLVVAVADMKTTPVDKKAGFIGELRSYAMKLHTKEQAPKEGGVEAPKQSWVPTREGYLRFLVESKVVYDALENLFATTSNSDYASLKNSGLERGAALSKDLQWFQSTYHMTLPTLAMDGPGHTYSRFLLELAETNPPAFMCHYYNFYFAHTAGGRMIGQKVGQLLLDSHTLEFYKWEGDVSQLLDSVRVKINDMAERWNEEQRQACLTETAATFKYAGSLMRCMTMAE